jgi:hypothetical protein
MELCIDSNKSLRLHLEEFSERELGGAGENTREMEPRREETCKVVKGREMQGDLLLLTGARAPRIGKKCKGDVADMACNAAFDMAR